MAVTDLHSLDVSESLDRLFSTGGAEMRGAVLSLVQDTPQINIGNNAPIVLQGRAKGALVHEGGAKPDNGRQAVARPFTTAKLVYSQRVTDEFMEWADDKQIDYVGRLINNWLRKSMPRDIDTVVLHGRDPFTGTLDTELSDYVTKNGSSVYIPASGTTAAKIDEDFGKAVKALEGQDINGIALSSDAAGKLATIMNGNVQKYTGLGAFGLIGDNLAGKRAASTPEVGQYNATEIVMGDWSQLLLGFAGEASWKVIENGDPDGTGKDLQQYNQICIRLELKFGFRVLDPEAFAVVQTRSAGSDS